MFDEKNEVGTIKSTKAAKSLIAFILTHETVFNSVPLEYR
jgi:hypothetical protein